MESKVISLFLGVLICCATVKCNELSVNFVDKDPVYTTLDAKLTFKCQINRNAYYILKASAEIIRVHNGEELVLTKSGTLEDGDPENYAADIETSETDTTLILHILKVRDEDDGTLVCRVKNKEPSETAEDKIEITVQRPLESLKLKINDNVIDKSMSEPLEFDSGKYDISCIAEGSNPATTNVHIYLHGEKVNHTDPVIEPIQGDLRKYRTTITGQISIRSAKSGEDLECSATSRLGNTLSVKFPISVRVHEPEIMCNDTYAYIGESYPVLMCTVFHQQSKLKSFKYFINDVEVQAGDQSSDFHDVTTEHISPVETVVKLRLNKVEESHFDAKFYLVLEHEDGHITRQPVTLHRIEGEADSSSESLFASLATVMLCVISAALSRV